MDVEYFRMLFDYNRWANAKILDQAVQASESDYFGTHAGLSFDNLHGTLLHLVGSEMTWLRRWSGQEAIPFTAQQMPDLAALLALRGDAEAQQTAFFATLTDERVNADNTYALPNGAKWTHKLGHQLGHWVNHATQYRSEAAVRLTELGRSPGGLDLASWLHNQR